MEGSISGWHVGLEYKALRSIALRAGLNDEHPTFGVGYANDRWQVDYCYMNRWNDDIAGGLFGGSDTHQLEAICRW